MAETKSKSRKKGTDTQQNEATASVREEASVATTTKDTKTMSETPSIFSFSEDISSAEPPVPLPVGDYPAEIRGAAIKTSGKGNQYVSVQFFVQPENYPADYTDGNPDGEVLSYNRVMLDDSPRGRHRMRKFCEAIGAKTGAQIDVNDWVGNTAIISVAEAEFEGEKRAEISKINRA